MTKYQVAKNTGVLYPVVHLSTRQLEEKGLARLVGKRPGKKATLTSIYDLTQEGLLFLATTERSFDLSLYAESHKDTDPTFFKIWEYHVARKIQEAMDRTFRFLSAFTQQRARSVRPAGGKTYLEYLGADYLGALSLKDLAKVIRMENMDRYFSAIVLHEGLYYPLIAGVKQSLNNYRRRFEEKHQFFQMLKKLHGSVEEWRKSGANQDEIERKLTQAMKEGLQEIMKLYSVPQ